MTEQEIEAIANRLADILETRLADKQSTFWLTKQEYAAINKISVRTLDNWIAAGRVETKPLGRKLLVANMAPSWQASEKKTTVAGKATGSDTIGRNGKGQFGSAL